MAIHFLKSQLAYQSQAIELDVKFCFIFVTLYAIEINHLTVTHLTIAFVLKFNIIEETFSVEHSTEFIDVVIK